MITLIDLLVSSFGISALCALIAVVFPRRLRLARNAATAAPATAAVVGFLSLCAALGLTLLYGLSLLLFITALLLPFAALAWIALATLGVIGWVVIAEPVGHMLLRRREVYAAPMAAAAIGGFVLTFGLQALSWLPLIGWIGSVIGFVLGSAGLGALLLTRLGTRSYPERHPASKSASAPDRLIL
ncbi:MAG: hypothetical protein ACYDBJ_16960 [Aggregatilineales bacterium]